jgi:hypothetical protein
VWQHVLVGSAPTGSINARAIRVPLSPDCLLLFDSGLRSFVRETVRIATLAATELEASSASVSDIETFRFGADTVLQFGDLLGAATISRDPRRRFLKPENPGGWVAQVALEASIECFILAHEYAHLLEGHTDEARLTASMIGDMEIHEWRRNWKDELDADRWAGRILMVAMRDEMGAVVDPEEGSAMNLCLALAGPSIFFSMASILENAALVRQSGLGAEKSEQDVIDEVDGRPPGWGHPPPAVRRVFAALQMAQLAGEDGRAVAQTSGFFHRLLTRLWGQIKVPWAAVAQAKG